MIAIWTNRTLADEQRRRGLYHGEIFVYDRLASVERLASFTRAMIEEAFAPHDPERVHEILDPTQVAAILGKLKPAFTHHPDSWKLMTEILLELGCDLGDIHCDVPKLRTAYPTDHLTKGIAYAFPAHRDTWYAGPQAQINWWLPLYSLALNNSMGFFPNYFDNAIDNDSGQFNYYRRNTERLSAEKFVTEDPRVQPAASGLTDADVEIRVLPSVGGMMAFSGAQLHRTVPNTSQRSRYSIDFRTVSKVDVAEGRGAPAVDVRCTGTALRDFRSAENRSAMPEELARKLDPKGPAEGEMAVFQPPSPSPKA